LRGVVGGVYIRVIMWFQDRKDLGKRLDELEQKLDTIAGERQQYQQEIEDMRRELQNFHLDYNNLYEKVRTNLAKLRKRAETPPEEAPPADPLAEARNALITRKLKRNA
jgi:DNA repair exonuclease SbcCD ATPase subunit